MCFKKMSGDRFTELELDANQKPGIWKLQKNIRSIISILREYEETINQELIFCKCKILRQEIIIKRLIGKIHIEPEELLIAKNNLVSCKNGYILADKISYNNLCNEYLNPPKPLNIFKRFIRYFIGQH